MRLPSNMDAPEKVLCQAHGQAKTVTDFLHENGKYVCSCLVVFAGRCQCHILLY